MSTPNYARNLQDGDFEAVTALPAAGAANQSPALDLGQAKVQSLEEIEFEIEIPALPDLADDKDLTLAVEDSADGVTFAAVDPAITTSVTGAGGAGAEAKSVRLRLPSQTRQYVRVTQAVEAAGGDNTGVSTTFRALF